MPHFPEHELTWFSACKIFLNLKQKVNGKKSSVEAHLNPISATNTRNLQANKKHLHSNFMYD